MLIDMTHTITPEIPIYPGTPEIGRASCRERVCMFV